MCCRRTQASLSRSQHAHRTPLIYLVAVTYFLVGSMIESSFITILSLIFAKYQRCTVHFYRNVFSVVPRSKVKLVAKMLKAIHAQESKKAAREKAKAVVAELKDMKLKEAAKKVEDGFY